MNTPKKPGIGRDKEDEARTLVGDETKLEVWHGLELLQACTTTRFWRHLIWTILKWYVPPIAKWAPKL